jgi:hypothetical protein
MPGKSQGFHNTFTRKFAVNSGFTYAHWAEYELVAMQG